MSLDKFREDYLPIIAAILIASLNLRFRFSEWIAMDTLTDKAVEISSICFGFLLAVLTLLLQTQASKLEKIKDAGRFGDLIAFNRKAVLSSAVLALVSLLYISLEFDVKIYHLGALPKLPISLLLDTFVLAIVTYVIFVVYIFLDLFYFLIR